jgi:hypothetical protein
MNRHARRRPLHPRDPLVVLVCLAAGRAAAQCPNPAIQEFMGAAGPICPATVGNQVLYEAVGRGRFISIDSVPLDATPPATVARVALDHPAWFMHSEVTGHIWATDGATIYGLNTVNPLSPQIVGRVTLSGTTTLSRLRVRGTYVYALDATSLYIIDVSNPAAPVLRSSLVLSIRAYDADIVGGYAYLSIDEGPVRNHSMLIVNVSNPLQPVEFGRSGNRGRGGLRVWKAPGSNLLYTLSRSSIAGVIEIWSLADPLNPQLQAANTTLDMPAWVPDDLSFATNTVCYLGGYPTTFRQFDLSTLQEVGQPIDLSWPDYAAGMGVHSHFALVTRSSGTLARINLLSSPPTVVDPYFDPMQGFTRRVATRNLGYTVLLGDSDLWLYASPPGGVEYPVQHVLADRPGYFSAPLVLLNDGTLFVLERVNAYNLSRILAFTASPAGLVWRGLYDFTSLSNHIDGLDAGTDFRGVRHVYFTTDAASSPHVFHVLDASDLGAMTETGTAPLFGGTSPLRFLPATSAAGPLLVLVGSFSGSTEIVSVQTATAPVSLGHIPSPSGDIAPVPGPTVWLLDQNLLKAYDISVPATPVLQSAIRIALLPDVGTAIRPLSGSLLGITTYEGDLVTVDASQPGAPVINQIARMDGGTWQSLVWDLAYDGTNLHIADELEGYKIVPVSFPAPPREDPNHRLADPLTQGIAGICPGVPLTFTVRFVANPANSYQWLRLNPATSSFDPIADGPTGTGSTVSGAATATLVVTNPGAADAGLYRCRATNTCGATLTDSAADARMGGYPNCDASTVAPALNVNDLVCYLNRFGAGDPYANCDNSTTAPVLNVLDFTCFLNAFAAACT